MKKIFLLLFLLPYLFFAQLNSDLQSLSKEFWQWRVVTQPATMDDIPRVERPDNWKPDYSPAALVLINKTYQDFRKRLNKLEKSKWSRADSVDYLCLRSAIERVNWEINILRTPYRNPDFYIQQTLGAFYELLVIPESLHAEKIENLIDILESIPKTLADGKNNLSEATAPFARIALDNLKDIGSKLNRVNEAIKKQVYKKYHSQFDEAIRNAISSLEGFNRWLIERLPTFQKQFNIGKDAYLYFLKNIALIPYTPEEMLKYGKMEFDRASLFESLEKLKGRASPKIFNSIEDEIAQVNQDENSIREFLVRNNIITVPAWLKHYTFRRTPEHLAPLTFIGESDDFTSENRLDKDAIRYTVQPDTNLSYFPLSIAKDPRPIIVHEGIPGHYFQLALSWKNPDPIRRRFVDSGSNEGIGFYVEEMLLQAGLFDERPYAKEIIYNFMRLRALRVEVDIQLALGNFSIEQAADYLEKSVPLDKESALERENRWLS